MDARPDSAYGIVAKIRPDSLDEANRALLCLLSTQAKWKTFQDVKQDTAWDEAMRYFTKQGDEDHLAKCYYYKGLVLKELGQDSTALRNLLTAQSHIDKTNDNEYRTLIRLDIGKLLNEHSLFLLAVPYFKQVCSIAEQSKDFRKIVDALCCRSFYYASIKRFDLSLNNDYNALIIATKNNLNSYYHTIYNSISSDYLELKRYDEAIKFSEKCLCVLNGDTTKKTFYYSHLIIGACRLKMFDYKEAYKHLMIAKMSPELDIQTNVLNQLAVLESIKNKYKESEALNDKSYLQYQEYLYQKDKQGLAAVHYNFLQQQSADAERISAQKGTFLYFCIFILSGLLCLIVFFVFLKSHYFFKYRKEIFKWYRTFEEKQNIRIEPDNEVEKSAKNTELKEKQQHVDTSADFWLQYKNDSIKLKKIFSAQLNGSLSLIQYIFTSPRYGMLGQNQWKEIKAFLKCIDPDFLNKIENTNLSVHKKEILMLVRLGVPNKTIGLIFNCKAESISREMRLIKKQVFSSEY
jgi:tetratricopeptide (TPR) repeat protein